jgi:hypothetical protein
MLPSLLGLLDVLKRKTNRFGVRGRHSTLFPVELPSWLSEDDMHEMITRFKQLLLGEIYDMMRRYRRTLSRQSISNSSTGSHMSDFEVGTMQDHESVISKLAEFYDSDSDDKAN